MAIARSVGPGPAALHADATPVRRRAPVSAVPLVDPQHGSLWSRMVERWRYTEETQADYDARQW